MKRLFASLMVVVMLTMCIQPCFASVKDVVGGNTDVHLRDLVVTVDASGGGGYTDENGAYIINSWYTNTTIDYTATLNMKPVQDVFDNPKVLGLFDENEIAEFKDGTVETTVTVTVEFPAEVSVSTDTLKTSGALRGDTFKEVSRTPGTNSMTIVFKNRDGLKVSDLIGNGNKASAALNDVVFELPSTIRFNEAGSYQIHISLMGQTNLIYNYVDAAENNVTLTAYYNGAGSHITNLTKGVVDEHKLLVVPSVTPTCTTSGSTEGVICATHNRYDCGAVGVKMPEELPATGHQYEHFDEVASTCISYGISEHYTCHFCKKNFLETGSLDEVSDLALRIPKAAHNQSGETIVGKSATCGSAGMTDGKKCSVCGVISLKQTIIPATGEHTGVPIADAVSAECEKDGMTAGTKCSVCNKVIESRVAIPATGHSFGDWDVTEPTETQDGVKIRACNNCDVTETVVLPKTGHVTHVVDTDKNNIKTPATCTTTGIMEQFCSCGTKIGEVEIPALGHKLTEIDALAGDCITNGRIAHHHCSVCGKNYKENDAKYELSSVKSPVNSSNHIQLVVINGVSPTCLNFGLTAGEKCSACNTITTPQIKIDKASCKANLEKVNAVPATCEETGVKEHWHCKLCDKDYGDVDGTVLWTKKDFVIKATGHDWKPAEQTGDEVVDGYIDAVIECRKDSNHKKYTKIPEADCNHTIVIGPNSTSAGLVVIDVKPTCTDTGDSHIECSLCSVTLEDNISVPKIEHNQEPVAEVPATCHTQGKRAHYKCSDCDQLFKKVNDQYIKIDAPETLDKISAHDYTKVDDYTQRCQYCNEVMKIKLIDEENDNAEINEGEVTLLKPAHIKQDDENLLIEKTKVETQDAIPETVLLVKKRKEPQAEQLTQMITSKLTENMTSDKRVYDIAIEKNFKYENTGVLEREPDYNETNTLAEIKIDIPVELRQFVDFVVFREHGGDTFDELKPSNDTSKERIKIAPDRSYIIIYTKKFSEYVVAGYSEIVNEPEHSSSSSSSGGGSSTFTIKFHANGGTIVESIKVKRGETITAPVPTRDGYIFAGWFEDTSFTKEFDFTKPIKSSVNLYAKWIEDDGTDNICDKFVDIDIDEWYHEGVHYAIENGMMNGTGTQTFDPAVNVSRAMLVTVLWRAENKPAATKESEFVDLEAGQYYVDAVKWANENGVVTGTTETTFAPDNAITREQFAAIMHRYAKLKGYDVSVGENTNILSYTDFDKISEYAIPAMQYAVGSGLIKGKTESTLNPSDRATRAEMATILYRFFSANK